MLLPERYTELTRLLFKLDTLSFASIKAALFTTFPDEAERVAACCAALLLLEDSRALNTAQRLGTWFLVCVGWTSATAATASSGTSSSGRSTSSSNNNNASPVAGYLVAVAEDERRCAVERRLVQQLLQPSQLRQLQLECCTPLDYALNFSLPVATQPARSSEASAASELSALREQLMPGLAGASTTELDRLLQDKKAQLMALVAHSGSTPAGLAISPLPVINHAAATGLWPNGHALRRSSPGSVVSDSSSTPNTPSNRLGHALLPLPALKAPSAMSDVSQLTSHRLSISGPSSSSMLPCGGSPTANGSLLQGSAHGAASGSAQGGGSRQGTVGGASTAAPIPEEKLVQVRELIERALTGPLMPAQQSVVLSALGEHPGVLAACGVGPLHLPALVEHTPSIAVELLLRLAGSPVLAEYLGVLAQSDMSLHGMEVVNRLTTSMEVPTEFLHLYITNCIHTCEATQDKYAQSRHVRLLCVFLQSLIRNRVIHIADLLHEVQSFCVNFSRIREAAKLFRLLKQIEAGGRAGGSDGPGSPTASSNNGGGLPGMDTLTGQAAPAVASTLST